MSTVDITLPQSEPENKTNSSVEGISVNEEGSEARVNEESLTSNKEGEEDKPELIGGKFQTQEDLLKAYQELEKKLGEKPQQNIDAYTSQNVEITDEARTEAAKAGVNISELQREFDTNGKLSEESYTKLEKGGIPRQIVDNYIATSRLVTEAQIKEIKDSVGGEEKSEAIRTWAATNLTPEERTAYNSILESRDANVIRIAFEGLARKYEDAIGREPDVTYGGKGGGNSHSVYADYQEVIADMADPRYQKSSTFRAQVAEKLARSRI